MSEAGQNRWFVNEDNCAVILHRIYHWRQSVMVHVTNHGRVNLIPVIGLSDDGATIIDNIVGEEIVPEASTIMTIPAIDANSVLFDELFVFLYYTSSEDVYGSGVQVGLEYQLLQEESFCVLDFHDEGCALLKGQPPMGSEGDPNEGDLDYPPDNSPYDDGIPDGGDDGDDGDGDDGDEGDCDTVVDSYDDISDEGPLHMDLACNYSDDGCDARSYCAVGQTFFTPDGQRYALCKSKFYIKKYGNPDGQLKVRLYEVTECEYGEPVGNEIPDIETGMLAESNAVNANELSESFEWTTFNFPEPWYCMEDGHEYALVLIMEGCSNCGWKTNGVSVAYETDPDAHPGNKFDKYDEWWYCWNYDVFFYAYGADCTGNGDNGDHHEGECDTIIDSVYSSQFSRDVLNCLFNPISQECDDRCYCMLGNVFEAPRAIRYGVCKVDFDLQAHGQPSGYLNAYIYPAVECDGGGYKPDFTEGWFARSDSVDISMISTVSSEWISFVFPEDQWRCLDAAGKYVIVIRADYETSYLSDNDYISCGWTMTGGDLTDNMYYLYDTVSYCLELHYYRYVLYGILCSEFEG